jgi:hypothetical protein
VCKGLVIDKLHRLKYNHNILTGRTCRASYGILYNEPYDRRRHSKTNIPTQIHKNPVDGQHYAINRICWLIEMGRPVLCDQPISRRFYRMISRADVDSLGAPDNMIRWVDTIAMSKTRPPRLPTWLQEGDAEKVGEIASELPLSQLLSASPSATSATVKHKKRRNWIGRSIGNYWQLDFELRMFAGSAGLRFEVWCRDRRIGDTGQVAVNWVYPPICRGLDVLVVGEEDDEVVETEVAETADPDWARDLVLMERRSSDGDLEKFQTDVSGPKAHGRRARHSSPGVSLVHKKPRDSPPRHRTALREHESVRARWREATKEFIKRGRNALRTAARAGWPDVIKELAKKGANIDAANKEGRTALHEAAIPLDRDDALRVAGSESHMQIEELLADKSKSFNVKRSNTVTCAWEVRDITRDNPEVGRFLESVLTLTAAPGYIEAAPCKHHLHKSYGSIALTLLESIIGALNSANGIYGSRRPHLLRVQ